MDNNSEEEKQNYLRENILDKGYEAEDFVSYLTQKKGDEGVDLNNWTLDELKLLVQEYIFKHPLAGGYYNIGSNTSNSPQMQQNTYLQQNQPALTTPIINENQNININPNYNSNNINNYNVAINQGITLNNNNNNLINNNNSNIPTNNNDNEITQNNNSIPNYTVYSNENGVYNEQNESTDIYGITNLNTILCSIIDKSDLANYENVQIEMSLGEKVSGSLFSKAYMTFIVSTSPLNFNVRRRYSDFEWLRQILQNFYSSSVIPPIPKKNKIGGDRFDELFLLKRKRNMEKFLNSLLDDPYIKISQIFYDFLSIEDEKKFIERKKYYNNFRQPKNLKEYKSPNGKLDISVNEDNEISFQNIKNNIEINQELLTKFNKNLKLLNNEMSSVVNRLEEISQNCEELFFNSVKFYDNDDIKISYYQLKDMFNNYSQLLKKQACLINVNIREYFKYKKNVFRSMKELTNITDNYKLNYYKLKRNLITKKEELFKKSDVSKWDLGPNKNISIVTLLKDKNVALPKMLFNETNTVINMKQIYGYYLNRVISEYERIKKLNGFGHKQNVSENAKMQITLISELFKSISDIAMNSQKYNIKNIEKEADINNKEKDEKK